jgi:UDP-glucuronate 4-epimerase
MKVLVTGGAGFIGSHLAEALIARGDQVAIVDCFEPFYEAATKRRNLETALKGGATLTETDIRDADGFLAQLRSFQPDVVVHLAARPGVGPSLEQPGLYLDLNVSGTLNVLDGCRRAGIGRLVVASSSSVYGLNRSIPFREADRTAAPASPYGATKAMAELLCHTYWHLHALSITCLRFFTVYGPRQRPDMAIHKFARLLAAGSPVRLYGDGSARDYTYVSDAVGGVVRAIDRVDGYRIYNIGSGRRIDLETVVSELGEALGVEPKVERADWQPGDVVLTLADVSLAKEQLGYEAAVSFPDGVRHFAEWFKSEQHSAIRAANRA